MRHKIKTFGASFFLLLNLLSLNVFSSDAAFEKDSVSENHTNYKNTRHEKESIKSKWSRSEVAMLRRLSITEPLAPLPSHSNLYANNPLAANLGEQIFFDTQFSKDGNLSCASCHQPEHHFTDQRASAIGMGISNRNTPTVVSTANYQWFYWDGRRDSLWSQALIPFEAANEMGSSRVAIYLSFKTDKKYIEQYQQLFGPLPNISSELLPAQAGPFGDLTTRTAWYRMNEMHRAEINQFYANIGKAIAAYERTQRLQPSRFDYFAQDVIKNSQTHNKKTITINSKLMSKREVQGLKLYLNDKKTHCRNCHNGKLFSNSEFYDIGTASLAGKTMDFGRALGVVAVKQDTFNCLGPFSDVKQDEQQHCLIKQLKDTDNPLAVGAFKTPTLRQLKKTAPYFHDGSMESLDDVMQHYIKLHKNFNDKNQNIDETLKKLKAENLPDKIKLSKKETSALIAFLLSLSY